MCLRVGVEYRDQGLIVARVGEPPHERRAARDVDQPVNLVEVGQHEIDSQLRMQRCDRTDDPGANRLAWLIGQSEVEGTACEGFVLCAFDQPAGVTPASVTPVRNSPA